MKDDFFRSRLYAMLSTLAMGRGRHAPMAMLTSAGGVQVYRGSRLCEAFEADLVGVAMEGLYVRKCGGEPRILLTQRGREVAAAGPEAIA